MYEIVFIAAWLIIGHGIKEILYRRKHLLLGFPLIPVIWPIIVLLYLLDGRDV